jgi:hypothetical protein
MDKYTDAELRHHADQLRAEVREAELELERLETLREAPGFDLRGSNLREMVRLTGSLAERVAKLRSALDELEQPE